MVHLCALKISRTLFSGDQAEKHGVFSFDQQFFSISHKNLEGLEASPEAKT
jgi:hypothetical protein